MVPGAARAASEACLPEGLISAHSASVGMKSGMEPNGGAEVGLWEDVEVSEVKREG